MKIKDSERLSYRLMNAGDRQFLFDLDQDEEVMRYINGGKLPTKAEVEDVYLPRLLSYTDPEKGWGMYQVCLKDDGQAIGWILVRPMDFFSDSPQWDNLELGWRFYRTTWGKGYATEAAIAIKNAFIEQKDIGKFTAIALEGNDASIKIMTKLGMHYVKTAIHEDPLGNEEVVYYEVSV